MTLSAPERPRRLRRALPDVQQMSLSAFTAAEVLT